MSMLAPMTACGVPSALPAADSPTPKAASYATLSEAELSALIAASIIDTAIEVETLRTRQHSETTHEELYAQVAADIRSQQLV